MINAQEWNIWSATKKGQMRVSRRTGVISVLQDESVLPTQKNYFKRGWEYLGKKNSRNGGDQNLICLGNGKSLIQLLVDRVWRGAAGRVAVGLQGESGSCLGAVHKFKRGVMWSGLHFTKVSRNEWRMDCKSSPQKHRVHYCQCHSDIFEKWLRPGWHPWLWLWT